MRKYVRGVEVYRFKDDETFDMYLSVLVYRALQGAHEIRV